MQAAMDQLVAFGTTYGLKIIGAVLILIIGRIAAGLGRRIVTRVLEKYKTDPAVTSFSGSLIYILILTFAVLAALAKFGVQTASFVAILGAAGFAVGFALQGSLGNFAAGVLILVFRPYRVGDFIEAAGVAGTVKEIQLFTTVLATPDNVHIMELGKFVESGTADEVILKPRDVCTRRLISDVPKIHEEWDLSSV